MYKFILLLHSGFRYLVLALMLWAILQSLAGWFGKKEYTEGNRKVNLFALISAHTQLLIGLILYFISPFVVFAKETMREATARYWTVEHIAMMIFAIVLITIGHSKSKKETLPEAKHRTIAIFYTLALIIVVVAIVQSKRAFFGLSS
ncbi:cytochrome B [Mucilaginibacter pedocola]|uniref:Cytochrome B n=1 Tax=Mucilaginibacter pedocola TaxID=1792845 RepID=A0A1S9P981_9SPHI|nr:cytochrome B [Mucilaginibacter pedocola]OOQ57520.1 cytochrome B [Mucilaginibacter pedocola]